MLLTVDLISSTGLDIFFGTTILSMSYRIIDGESLSTIMLGNFIRMTVLIASRILNVSITNIGRSFIIMLKKLKNLLIIVSVDIVEGVGIFRINSQCICISFMLVHRMRGPLVLNSRASLIMVSSTCVIILEQYVSLFVIKHCHVISLHNMLNNETWLHV